MNDSVTLCPSTIAKQPVTLASVNTTLAHYIKDVPEVTKNAMTQVEALFTQLDGQSVQ